jgi:hypothetical protein
VQLYQIYAHEGGLVVGLKKLLYLRSFCIEQVDKSLFVEWQCARMAKVMSNVQRDYFNLVLFTSKLYFIGRLYFSSYYLGPTLGADS